MSVFLKSALLSNMINLEKKSLYPFLNCMQYKQHDYGKPRQHKGHRENENEASSAAFLPPTPKYSDRSKCKCSPIFFFLSFEQSRDGFEPPVCIYCCPFPCWVGSPSLIIVVTIAWICLFWLNCLREYFPSLFKIVFNFLLCLHNRK